MKVARSLASGVRFASSKVGFIGLGNMGKPMALNLARAGHDLVVLDLNPTAVAELEGAGAASASTAAEVMSQVGAGGAVVTMLPSNPHVQGVYCGEGGILETMAPDTLCIDCSTITPGTSVEVAAAVRASGGRMIDAPVSGGVGGAEGAALTFMVGGTTRDVAAATPFLEKMGTTIHHCGDVGAGEAAKICNNMVLGVSMAAVSEAMNLGDALGIDATVLAKVINSSSGRCWSSEVYNPFPGVVDGAPASRGYTGGFGAALMKKDLSLAADAAASVNEPLPIGSLAFQLYSLMCANGGAEKDFSAMIQFLQAEQKKK